MKYAWLVTLVLAPLFIAKAVVYPPGDGDLFWQRWLGATILREHHLPRALGPETFAAPGAPWVPQEWLFSLGLAISADHAALVWFHALIGLCAVATLALVAVRGMRLGANSLVVAACTGLTGIALLESLGVRVQVAAWPIVALFLIALDEDGAWLWATVPIAALWSNVHASAMLAPVLAGTAAAGAVLEDRAWTSRVRRHIAVAGACALAIVCNPLGAALPRYAVMLFSSPIKHFISEWKLTDAADESFLIGALPLLLAAMLVGIAKTGKWKQGLLFAAFTVLLFGAARNIAVFSIAVAPVVAAAVSAVLPLRPQREATRLDRIMRIVIPAFGGAVAAIVGVTMIARTPPAFEGLPVAAMAALDDMPGSHRLLCGDFAWCSLGFPAQGGLPHQRVFIDGRADPYPVDVWHDFVTIAHLDRGWRERIAARGIDAILVKRDAPLAQALALLPQWHVAYTDATFRVFLCGGAASARRDDVQFRGPQERLALRVDAP